MNTMLDQTKMLLIAAIQLEMKAIKTYRTRRNNEGKMSVVWIVSASTVHKCELKYLLSCGTFSPPKPYMSPFSDPHTWPGMIG